MLDKPDRVFDRDFEWGQLARFATRSAEGVQLGVVSGRRRQGKTFLLDALTTQAAGFYFGATQAAEAESLHLFAQALAARLDLPVPPRFASWDEAMIYLFTAPIGGPVVLDEFPYLSKVSPQLPSIIQREFDRRASRGESGIRLLLCGSAMSVMGGLLAGTAPLRGRAGLELIVRPFDYPLAAEFWGITRPRLAAMTHAVVGGTPAYRRFIDGDAPSDEGDFDGWIERAVLNPASPLFREARYLLEEEAEVRDSAVYHSVLGAVASGNNSRGGIAGYVGRKANEIGHHLTVLEDSALIRKHPDLFHANRSTYRIAEPLLTFYQVVMRPQWSLLESGRAALVWPDAKPRFQSQVLGPHFEQMCRDLAILDSQRLFGALPGEVGSGVVVDPSSHLRIEIDVAVLGPAVPGERRRVLSLGEAKWGKPLGVRHVQRLRRARDLLAQKGYDTRDTILACYGGAGFDPELRAEAEVPGVALIGPERLYAAG